MDLNIPETRQGLLADRLANGGQIVATDVAGEFGVSVDTVRRDIIALEEAGKAHRVRGGAVPVARPAGTLTDRVAAVGTAHAAIANAALARLAGCSTLLLDGGSTVLCLAERLRPADGLVVMTPSPWVAVACHRNGVECFMLGGRLSVHGGINVGEETASRLSDMAADVAVLGACGLEAGFGMSSDDFEESQLKQAMAESAARCIVLTDAGKIGRRARHRTLLSDTIDLVVTDADRSACADFVKQGVEIDRV